jgi:predicted DNA-binding transcriptional regulator AlpA
VDITSSEILSRKQAAEFLGICRNTLDRQDIPRTKIGRRVLYKREVLKKWIDDHTEKEKRGKK